MSYIESVLVLPAVHEHWVHAKLQKMFVERHPDAASFKVTLYGSLTATEKS